MNCVHTFKHSNPTSCNSEAKVNPKSCNHLEKRSATASDWGGQSEAKTNPTSCDSGLKGNFTRLDMQ